MCDASHRRLGKKKYVWTDGSWQPSGENFFIYFGNREVGAVDEQNDYIEFRVLGRGKGAELGASVGIEIDGAVFCPIHDHRGNITALVDTVTRQVHETYRYSAFGEEQLFDAAGIACASVSNPWRFASKRSDPETGFVFFGRRYYSSQTGRFLTPDPVGFSDGPNLYAYVHNSPMVLIDPYGLTAMEDAGEAGVEAGMGFGRGFLDPFKAYQDMCGQLVGLGHDLYRSDFSRFSNSSRHDVAMFASARVGEAAGIAAFILPIGKLANGIIRGGMFAIKQGYACIVAIYPIFWSVHTLRKAMIGGGVCFLFTYTYLFTSNAPFMNFMNMVGQIDGLRKSLDLIGERFPEL